MTKLLVVLDEGDAWTGGDGFVADAGLLSPEDAAGAEAVLLRGSPGKHPEWSGFPGALWVVDQGLDAAVKLRDYFPDALMLPRVQAYRPSTRYSLGDRYPGEGFRVFTPDTAAFRTWRVDDGDEVLGDWLAKATGLGFDSVWLDGRDAVEAGRGYDLDLLERARKHFEGRIILSGGASELKHFTCLREEGGCFAAVLSAKAAASIGCAEVIAQLRPPVEQGLPSDQEGAAA